MGRHRLAGFSAQGPPWFLGDDLIDDATLIQLIRQTFTDENWASLVLFMGREEALGAFRKMLEFAFYHALKEFSKGRPVSQSLEPYRTWVATNTIPFEPQPTTQYLPAPNNTSVAPSSAFSLRISF